MFSCFYRREFFVDFVGFLCFLHAFLSFFSNFLSFVFELCLSGFVAVCVVGRFVPFFDDVDFRFVALCSTILVVCVSVSFDLIKRFDSGICLR